MKLISLFLARLIGLSLWHFISIALAGLIVGSVLTAPVVASQELDIVAMILVSIFESAVLLWLATRLNSHGIRLILVLVLVFHGTKNFMMLIEAAFFLNIWTTTPLLSLADIGFMEIHGLLMSLLYCPAIVLMVGKWRIKEAPKSLHALNGFSLSIRIGVVAVIYTLCYLLAGALILIPLAGDAFNGTYENLHVPTWMPLFQVARGILWALIALPIVRIFSGSGLHLRTCLGAVFAILGSVQLLYPNPYMTEGLRNAHLIEVTISMFVFGWLSAWVLSKTKEA